MQTLSPEEAVNSRGEGRLVLQWQLEAVSSCHLRPVFLLRSNSFLYTIIPARIYLFHWYGHEGNS